MQWLAIQVRPGDSCVSVLEGKWSNGKTWLRSSPLQFGGSNVILSSPRQLIKEIHK